MRNKFKLLGMIAVLFLLLTGCSILTDNQPSSPSTLTIKPVELYKGDRVKFKPFLGESSGSIKIEYVGEKKNLGIWSQIWENGVPNPNSGGGSYDFMFNLKGDRVKYSAEIIVAMKPRNIDGQAYYELTTSIVTDSGSSTSTQMYVVDEKQAMTVFHALNDPIKIEGDGEVIIMGIESTSSHSISTKSIEQARESAEWFLGLTLFVTDEEHPFRD